MAQCQPSPGCPSLDYRSPSSRPEIAENPCLGAVALGEGEDVSRTMSMLGDSSLPYESGTPGSLASGLANGFP